MGKKPDIFWLQTTGQMGLPYQAQLPYIRSKCKSQFLSSVFNVSSCARKSFIYQRATGYADVNVRRRVEVIHGLCCRCSHGWWRNG